MTDVPVVGVLALQGDVREHLIALAAADAVARPVRRPEDLAEVDGLVIPGGESTTISKLAVLFGLMEPLRARVRAGMPVYGTCAGMIMLADKILDPRSGQETIGGIDMITNASDARFGLLGARFVGEETLNRFYVLHCIAIPLAAATLMAIHFWRVRKDGGISGPL